MKLVTKNKNGITRGRFLGFLGKIGLLSLIPGIYASAAEKETIRIEESEKKTELRRYSGLTKMKARSPLIKGKMLSSNALEAKLATENLENIRDLLTGRFFGKVAERKFRNGYVPLINWNLGGDDGESGCFLFAELVTPGSETGFLVDQCIAYLRAIEELGSISVNLSPGSLPSSCPDYCPNDCGAVCTCYSVCPNDDANLNFYDFVSYPGDKFVTEITDILKTTDIGVIQNELRDVIFSDEVLNMGLQHFVMAAHGAMIDDIEASAGPL